MTARQPDTPAPVRLLSEKQKRRTAVRLVHLAVASDGLPGMSGPGWPGRIAPGRDERL